MLVPTRPRRSSQRGLAGVAALCLLATPALAGAASPSVASPAGEIVPPRPLTPLRADYPPGAKGAQDVLLELTVDADGHTGDAHVVEGVTPFTTATLQASRAWLFAPATHAGKPLRARIRARIHFTPALPVEPAPAQQPAPGTPAGAGPTGSAAPLEVVVLGTRSPGSITLAQADVRVLPGAFGDAFRAIEALPGVTPILSGLPYFYVRGAPPGNVGYFIDGVRVPALFHLAAGPAVLPGALIDHVELFPGGYPAEYGRYTGGILAAETRAPSTTFHAEGVLRLIDAGAVAEAPLPGGLGSALVGGRYSYTAPVLSLFVPDYRFDYWDYQARLVFNLSAHDRVTLFAFGSHDYAGQEEAGVWYPVFASEFHRLDLRYDAELGDRTQIRQGLTLGLDQTGGGMAGFYPPTMRDKSLAARTRVTHRVDDAVLIHTGLDATLDAYQVEASNPYAPVDVEDLFPSRQDLAVGVYADAVIEAGRGVEITPGVRADLWRSQGATALSADARLAMRVPVTSRVRLLDAVGLTHQAPGFAVPLPGVAVGRLAGGLQKSFQTSAGVEADLPLSITASATVFYNAFFNLNDPASVPLNAPRGVGQAQAEANSLDVFDTRSLGSALGMEIYVRRRLTERLGGYLAYTLSRSTRTAGKETFAAQFDRTHVIDAALSWDIGLGFRVGARVAFSSGAPLSPFVPAYALAQAGVENRLPPFARLDVRAEKRWTLGARGWLAVVLEGQNVTLSKEAAGIKCAGYSMVLAQSTGCTEGKIGPVTLPSLGLEGGV